MGPRFWLWTVPVFGMALLATLVGLSPGPNMAGGEWLIASLAAALLCFVGSLTFQKTPWSVLLLVGLALAIGVVLGMLMPESLSQPWMPVVTAVLLLVAAGAVGRAWPRMLRPIYRPLWWLAVAILVVGVVLSLTQAAGLGERPSWPIGWSLTWGILFVVLSAAWFAGLEREPSSGAPLHLYLLWLNLLLSTALLRQQI